MFVKLATIAMMAFVANCQEDKVWDGYSGKWAANPKDGFYQFPQKLKTAKCQGWIEIPGCDVPDSVKALGFKGDPRLALLFSAQTGKVIGHQIGLPVADLEKVPINYAANPALTKRKLNGTDYYTAVAFYQQNDEGNIRKIWLMVNNKLVEIPTTATQLSAKTTYHSKRCITWMGHHYYQIKANTTCVAIFPWVPLIIKGKIIGLVFQSLGKVSSAPSRKWFEDLPLEQLAYTIPDTPSCIGEYMATYGLTSFHVWFKKNPLGITCSDECTSKYDPDHELNQTDVPPNKNFNASAASGDVCPIQ